MASKQELHAHFKRFDTDGNGLISRDEACTVLQKELGFGQDKFDRFFSVYDKNKDNTIDYQEFIMFYYKVKDMHAQLLKKFKELDKDGNNYITFEEAREGLQSMGFTDQHIKNLIALADTNKDGMLDFDEFGMFWNA